MTTNIELANIIQPWYNLNQQLYSILINWNQNVSEQFLINVLMQVAQKGQKDK